MLNHPGARIARVKKGWTLQPSRTESRVPGRILARYRFW
jgi:hypothetical protein